MARIELPHLTLAIDDATRRIERIRRRPGGYSLPFTEPLSSWMSGAKFSGPAEIIASIATPFIPLDEHAALELATVWDHGDLRVRRTMRFPKEKVPFMEAFQLDYEVRASGSHTLPLVETYDCVAHDQEGSRIDLYTSFYKMNLVVEGDCRAAVSIAKPSDESPPIGTLSVTISHSMRLRILCAIFPREQRTRDSATFLVPGPPDEVEFVLASLIPGVFGAPLSRSPQGGHHSPSPFLLYLPPLEDAQFGETLGWPLPLVDGTPAACHPLREFPLGSMVRRSLALVYLGRPGVEHPIESIAQVLSPGNPTTQRWLILDVHGEGRTREPFGADEEAGQIGKNCILKCPNGPVTLDNLTSAVDYISQSYDEIQTGGQSRARTQMNLQVRDLLPPIRIPRGLSPIHAAPLLVAARLRGAFEISPEDDRERQPWPVDVTRDGRIDATKVASAVLTDIETHRRLRQHPEPYEQAWRTSWLELEARRARAERVILVGVSGTSRAFDRTKLLPAILHSGEVSAPVVPFPVTPRAYARFRSLFARHLDLIGRLVSLANHPEEAEPADAPGISPELVESERAVQAALESFIPADVRDLLRTTRPYEVLNYSHLPLEWLQLDDMPLGYLTNVSTLRSLRPDSDLGYCGDVAAQYCSQIDPELHNLPDCRVVVVAPNYADATQVEVNRYVNDLAKLFVKALGEERDKGRDITVIELRGNVTAREVQEELARSPRLVVFVGHATGTAVVLSNEVLGARGFSVRPLLGTSFILIGCDTQGPSELEGSLATSLQWQGARAVISMNYMIALRLAREIVVNLVAMLIQVNARMGDAVTVARVDAVWAQAMYFHARQMGRRVKSDVAFMPPPMRSFLRQWDAAFVELRRFFGSTWEDLRSELLLPGLALSLGGDTRARLLDF